jgi:hypothetical protein
MLDICLRMPPLPIPCPVVSLKLERPERDVLVPIPGTWSARGLVQRLQKHPASSAKMKGAIIQD